VAVPTTYDADEVTVDASGFSGNLSGTDTDVQTALETIDAFSLGDFSEFMASTGTRVGGNLITTIGDYDDSGNGTKLIINQSENTISLDDNSVLVVPNIVISSSTWEGNIGSNLLTAQRAYDLPNASGTIALQEWVTAQGYSTGGSTVDVVSNVATSTILGRTTAGSGDSEELTPTQVRTLLNVADGATVNSTDATLLARANHTGTQTSSTISNFDTAVTSNSSVTANTAKVTNATHTGEVTGSTTLTVNPTAVSNKSLKSTLAGTEEVLINDAGTLKKTTAQDIADLGGGGNANLTAEIVITNPTLSTNFSQQIVAAQGANKVIIPTSIRAIAGTLTTVDGALNLGIEYAANGATFSTNTIALGTSGYIWTRGVEINALYTGNGYDNSALNIIITGSDQSVTGTFFVQVEYVIGDITTGL
jgi:hypothetical protein